MNRYFVNIIENRDSSDVGNEVTTFTYVARFGRISRER